VPTYQYRCTGCGDELEVVQKFSDDPLTVCPSCQGSLRKVFSPVGIVFKGSGFYRNDSRKSPASAGDGAKDGAKKDKEPAGAKSAESSSGAGKSSANGSSGSSDSSSSSGSSAGSPSSGKSGKSSPSAAPAASAAG